MRIQIDLDLPGAKSTTEKEIQDRLAGALVAIAVPLAAVISGSTQAPIFLDGKRVGGVSLFPDAVNIHIDQRQS